MAAAIHAPQLPLALLEGRAARVLTGAALPQAPEVPLGVADPIARQVWVARPVLRPQPIQVLVVAGVEVHLPAPEASARPVRRA